MACIVIFPLNTFACFTNAHKKVDSQFLIPKSALVLTHAFWVGDG